MMRYCLKSWLTAAQLLFMAAMIASAQQKHPLPTDNPGIVRWEDPKATCKFAPEYRRIRANKTDPRVAYMEVGPLLGPKQPEDFDYRCKNIAVQSEDVEATVFDKARSFLQVVYGEGIDSTAVAYFAPKPGGEGIMLYVQGGGDNFKTHVFTYRDTKWQDVSPQYLGPLHLTKNDYLVVPQYGRTARLMSYDPHEDQFHPKGWITWDGTKFVAAQRPANWKCPDSYRYLPASERAQVCR